MALTDKIKAIANSIRWKTGGTKPLTLDQMAAEIANIKTDTVLEPLTVTENGEYTPGDGVDGFSKVTVEVTQDPAIEDAIVSGTLTGEYCNDRVTELALYAFAWVNGPHTANFPSVTGIPGSCFYNNKGITSVKFPNATYIASTGGFVNCAALTHLDLGSIHTLTNNTIVGATSLTNLILRRKTGVCALQSTNAVDNTPFAKGGVGGKVYVPSSLIESYIADANWSVIYGYGTIEFVALEGSEYE